MSLENRKTAQLEDPGAELLDRAQGIWERYGRIVLGAVGAIAVLAVLGFFMMRSRATSESQAAAKLAEANMLFWQGQYDRSLEIAKQVSAQFGSTPSGIDAHRLAGDDLYWNAMLLNQPEKYKESIVEFRAYLSKAKGGVLADAARRSLANALESDRQFEEAAKTYGQIVGKLGRESSAEFLLGASRCYVALGKKAEAAKELQRIIDEFGDTSYAPTARVKLAEIQVAP